MQILRIHRSTPNHDPSQTNRPTRLSATFVRTVNVPGRDGYGGNGLSLMVKRASSGRLSKAWAQTIRPNDRTTSVGLGRYPVVTLAMARERALANARALARGATRGAAPSRCRTSRKPARR